MCACKTAELHKKTTLEETRDIYTRTCPCSYSCTFTCTCGGWESRAESAQWVRFHGRACVCVCVEGVRVSKKGGRHRRRKYTYKRKHTLYLPVSAASAMVPRGTFSFVTSSPVSAAFLMVALLASFRNLATASTVIALLESDVSFSSMPSLSAAHFGCKGVNAPQRVGASNSGLASLYDTQLRVEGHSREEGAYLGRCRCSIRCRGRGRGRL